MNRFWGSTGGADAEDTSSDEDGIDRHPVDDGVD
jgi:hypothetical protein